MAEGDGTSAVIPPDDPEAEADRVYRAFRAGSRLLDDGDAHAAVVALERARSLAPDQGSVREALARAYFAAGRVEAAEAEFTAAVAIDPVNDYAHFGLGVCRLRAGDRVGARRHLRLAVAMHPRPEYRRALARTGTP